jgi:hypothetical protein
MIKREGYEFVVEKLLTDQLKRHRTA